jgi:hypothetical protein
MVNTITMISFRRHLRYPFPKKNHYNASITLNRYNYKVDIKNISAGGTFVELSESLPDGAQIELSFSLPGVLERYDLPCVVRWSRNRGAGLQFVSLSANEMHGLNQFIERLKSADC